METAPNVGKESEKINAVLLEDFNIHIFADIFGSEHSLTKKFKNKNDVVNFASRPDVQSNEFLIKDGLAFLSLEEIAEIYQNELKRNGVAVNEINVYFYHHKDILDYLTGTRTGSLNLVLEQVKDMSMQSLHDMGIEKSLGYLETMEKLVGSTGMDLISARLDYNDSGGYILPIAWMAGLCQWIGNLPIDSQYKHPSPYSVENTD